MFMSSAGNIRNLAMEKVASTVMIPCKYSTSGCAVSLLQTEKGEHEETCEFRPYSCPCPGASCKWQGSLEQVMPHLMMSHKSITTLQGNKAKHDTCCIFSPFYSRIFPFRHFSSALTYNLRISHVQNCI